MTEVDLLNKALAYLGEARVQSLTQNTNSAKYGSDAMRSSVEEVLQLHPWNSALKRVTLARLTTENSFGPRYQYQLPIDYITLIAFNDDVSHFSIEGNILMTDETVVEILYVGYPDDFSILDAGLVRAIASNLAFNISINITGEIGTQARMLELHERYLARARTHDARNSSRADKSIYAETLQNSPILQVRNRRGRNYSSITSDR